MCAIFTCDSHRLDDERFYVVVVSSNPKQCRTSVKYKENNGFWFGFFYFNKIFILFNITNAVCLLWGSLFPFQLHINI